MRKKGTKSIKMKQTVYDISSNIPFIKQTKKVKCSQR